MKFRKGCQGLLRHPSDSYFLEYSDRLGRIQGPFGGPLHCQQLLKYSETTSYYDLLEAHTTPKKSSVKWVGSESDGSWAVKIPLREVDILAVKGKV